MKPDYWRKLSDCAEKYDLELVEVSGVKNAMGVAIAELALREIDAALIETGDTLGTTLETNHNVIVTARRFIKTPKPSNRTYWRK